MQAAAQRLRDGHLQPLDAGEVTMCHGAGADPTQQYFVNISSCGFSARVSRLVRLFKWLGPFGACVLHTVDGDARRLHRTPSQGYTVAAALAFAGFRNSPAVVFVDGVPHTFGAMTMVAVANGRYFGGGMCIAADADPADGQLTVVVLDGQTSIDFALKKRHFFNGTIATQRGVTVLHGRRVQVVPASTGARCCFSEQPPCFCVTLASIQARHSSSASTTARWGGGHQ